MEAEPQGSSRNYSGWVTTAQAARALRVTPRSVRMFIEQGRLSGKLEKGSGKRVWLVSVDSVNTLRAQRMAEEGEPILQETADISEGLPETIKDLADRLAREAADAAEMRARYELTERAESTIREERDRLLEDLRRERERADRLESSQEEAARLREELAAERSKGFFRRLFGV